MSDQEELPPVTLRGYRPGDEVSIVATFNRVFDEIDPTFEPRTLEQWRWSNLENPSGSRILLAVAEDGRLAAHVSGIPQRALVRGEARTINQSVDGFSHPDWRRALKRPGIYADTMNAFNRGYAGPAPDGDVFVWGMPVLTAWRIGHRFCEEQLIRTQNKLVLDAGRMRPAAAPGVEVEEVERFPEEVAQLFARAARSHGVIAVRDAAQLDWRFVQNPFHRYRIALARQGGELVGYAVYRLGAYDAVEGALVCDWLTDPERPQAGAALRAWLEECRSADGAACMTAVFPDTTAEWIDFQRSGYRVRSTHYFPAAYFHSDEDTADWLHREWYYTLGDSDLC